MTNQEIADAFAEHIPENAPKDFYDRYLDVAIYVNETTKPGPFTDSAINSLEDALEIAYTTERI